MATAGRVDPGADETRPARPLLVVALAGAAARSNVEEVGGFGVYRLELEVGTYTSLPIGTSHATCPTCGEWSLHAEEFRA